MSENESGGLRRQNRLSRETSPYLIQHADNPVDWYPWSGEAFEKARAEGKPILLSIGYASCHWCHVMAHESFEDDAVAAVMNEHFVCVKVDREERPDIDDVYMKATQAMNQGQGGWPMTVFMTPDGKPFFAGTYFPPEDKFGRPSFSSLLDQIAGIWRSNREELVDQAESLTRHIQPSARSADAISVGESELRAFVDQLWYGFDEQNGGFGGEPKFPPHGDLPLLLRCHRRFKDERAYQMAVKTLDAMASGGIHDQVGGGFHRYSVDAHWLVPHFEKMLYDNAQLAASYFEGYQASGNSAYLNVATGILDYVLREMTDAAGGFYSAADADSEGEEGKFFVWTPSEIATILGAESARVFCAYYDISDRGNWEGKNIPNVPKPPSEVAATLGLSVEELDRQIAAARPKVYEARRRRLAPGIDDKILVAWNGLMISAMAEGFRVTRDRRYIDAASRAADFILTEMCQPSGRLYRAHRAGKSHVDGFLEDYANFANGLIGLYESGGDFRYLREASALADRMLADFADASGGAFYSTSDHHERLISRTRDGHDGAVPNDNAMACAALARLSFHFARAEYRDAAIQSIRAYGRAISSTPRGYARSLSVVDFLMGGPSELAFIGALSDARCDALWREAARHYAPNRIIAHGAAESADGHPLLAGKGLVGGLPALYVCRDFACLAPVTNPADVERALGAVPAGAAPASRTAIGKRLEGAASAVATRRYAGRFSAQGLTHGYGPLGSTGLTVSRVGFGCYRIDDETDEHLAALTKALMSGCNVIDTSTNYADGASERAVGIVVNRLAQSGKLQRDEIVIVSKIGYIQGANYALAVQREASGRPFPETVKLGEGLWHCMHPEFLDDQLTRLLDRLEIDTLDVCLIHNPEYFLAEKKNTSREPIADVRTEFYRRLREAFAYLESHVSAGRIRWYGVSSNTCVAPSAAAESTSLSRMIEAARAAAGDQHHFRVLQLPLNLLEPGAVLELNNGMLQAVSTLDCAAQNGIAVLANRPLNAIMKDSMIRLADPDVPDAGANLDVQLAELARLEAEFRRDFSPRLKSAAAGIKPDELFRWSEELARVKAHRPNLDQWTQMEQMMILPNVVATIQAIDRGFGGAGAGVWDKWRDRYLGELQKLMAAFQRDAALKSRDQAQSVSRAIDFHLPAEIGRETLARKALWVVAGTTGVSCALNGMRRESYVADALSVLTRPQADMSALYQRLKDEPPVGGRVSLIVP